MGCKCVSQGMSAATRYLSVELPPLAALRKALGGWKLGGAASAPAASGVVVAAGVPPRVAQCLVARRPLGVGRGVRAPAYTLPALAVLGLSRVPPSEGHLHVAQRAGVEVGRREGKAAVEFEMEEGQGKVTAKGAF